MTDDDRGSMKDSGQHKHFITSLFDQVASGYDSPALRFFPFCADRMVNLVRPKPGSKVLDVATGTGVVAVAMGQAVGSEGRVHAIDLAEEMLTKAQINVQKMALDNVDFHQMDAECLDFKGNYFHATVCSYGLFFIPDMQAALRDWVRVTRPGGKVVFSGFGTNAFNGLIDCYAQQIVEFGGTLPELDGGIRFAIVRLGGEAGCRELMSGAGLVDQEVHSLQLGYHLSSAHDWWEVVWNSGFRTLLNTLPAGRLEDFKQAHLAAIDAMAGNDGIWMDVETLVAVGSKSA